MVVWIMGGGRHTRMSMAFPGGGRCSLIMLAVTKPELYLQPVMKQSRKELWDAKNVPDLRARERPGCSTKAEKSLH
jgi:hypothetical protein